MTRTLGSQSVSDGVLVRVDPEYLAKHSNAEEGRFVFSYRVLITNQSDMTLRLQRRHWVIVDADGSRQEVEGEGVVGQTPTLSPGENFEYSSWCALKTDWGTMEGSYTMQGDEGREVVVPIARFYLVAKSPPPEDA